MRHLETLRSIQKETGGFTELVPLSFVHEEAPMHVKQLVPGLRPGATPVEVARLFADRAAHARTDVQEPPGLVGQAGAGDVARAPGLGRQRFSAARS